MKMKMKMIFLVWAILGTVNLFAHPVIYKDGVVLWTQLSSESNVIRGSYTFDPSFSVELNSTYYRNLDKYRDYTLGVNYLVKRWLGADSQGNIYVQAHAGFYEQKEVDENGFVAHGMLMGDWESRKYYTAGGAMLYYFNDQYLPKFNARIGFAPYDAGMDALQSWLILQVSYFEENSKNIEVTPMLRFFYKNVLWEVGASLKGDFFLTLMTHM